MDIVISCFDISSVFVKPWADAGYLCYCVDLQHPRGETREGNIIKVGIDIAYWMPPKDNVCFAAFFPPCTDLSVSGARWFKGKGLFALSKAINLFAHSVRLAEWIDAPYFIENPISTISTYWRKPDYIFHPHEYGGYLEPPVDLYYKKTCLWVGNGFKMPPKKVVPPSEGQKIWKMPPSKDRANLRSVTPLGFSQAVFEHNSSYNKTIHSDEKHPLSDRK